MAHYIDNKRFTAEIIAYNESRLKNEQQGLHQPKMNDYLGQSILLIANRLINKKNFANYTWRDSMLDEAITAMVAAVPKFDISKLPKDKPANALAYFTTVCNRAFINRIVYENKQLSINESIVINDENYRFVLSPYDDESDFCNIHSNTDDLLSIHNKSSVRTIANE